MTFNCAFWSFCVFGALAYPCLLMAVMSDRRTKKAWKNCVYSMGAFLAGMVFWHLSHGTHDPLLLFFALIMAIPAIDQMRQVWQNGH